jgi:leucyl-tRNA---protein transferase
MISDCHFLPSIKGATLDQYLECGWYRMGQLIFTTNTLEMEQKVYPIVWLRYALANYKKTNSHKKILAAAKRFNISVVPFKITPEANTLYRNYRNQLPFFISPTLYNSLYYNFDNEISAHNVYDTYAVEIRDNNKLIGLGVFDIGTLSIAGIINCYDHNYAKYSIGKLIMLHKLAFAQQQHFDYYYPGYVVQGNNRFNYKLFIGEACTEALVNQQWQTVPYLDQWLDSQQIY